MKALLTLLGIGIWIAIGAAISLPAHAAVKTFTGAGNWNAANWAPSPPVAGDDAVVDGDVTLTNTTVVLTSYTLNATRTHIFEGTNTILRATNVVINGAMTHTTNTDTAATWEPDNLLQIEAASNVSVGATGSIDVDGKGYMGLYSLAGYGPGGGGKGGNEGGGGGYGGRGADADAGGGLGGATYGLTNAPVEPGSGGGNCGTGTTGGGEGGGAVRIQAGGVLLIDGSISANGTVGTSYGSGGGSGGSVYLTCGTIQGSGSVTADGGDGYTTGDGGGGGGGRIAVIYSSSPAVTIRFSAAPGTSHHAQTPSNPIAPTAPRESGLGTLYLSDTNFLPTPTLTSSYELLIPGFTAWSPSTLSVTGGWVRLPPEFTLDVANDMTIGVDGIISLGEHTALMVGGSLTLTNGGEMYFDSGTTNASGTWTNYGGLVSVQGDMVVASNSVLHPVSHPINGGTPYFLMDSLSVALGGHINANGTGYKGRGDGAISAAQGPGAGDSGGNEGAGGGYGGIGGDADASRFGGGTYGSSNAPVDPGSGAGSAFNDRRLCNGGGSIRIKTSIFGTATIDGTVSANGVSPLGWAFNYGMGGGAGGGITIDCGTFEGSGLIEAQGGSAGTSGDTGGGGGGRIAILRVTDSWLGTALLTNIVVLGGTGDNAGTHGTVFLGDNQLPPPAGTVMWVK